MADVTICTFGCSSHEGCLGHCEAPPSPAPTVTGKLLPCPFCGGPVTMETNTSKHLMYGERKWWGIKCRNTINRGGTCAVQISPSASEEAAVDRWNRRSPTPPDPAAHEGLQSSDNSETTNWQAAEPQVITIRPTRQAAHEGQADVVVIQVDRDAAGDVRWRDNQHRTACKIHDGELDDSHIVQAFAAHRLSSLRQQAGEVEALREECDEGNRAFNQLNDTRHLLYVRATKAEAENERLREAIDAVINNWHVEGGIYQEDIDMLRQAREAQG